MTDDNVFRGSENGRPAQSEGFTQETFTSPMTAKPGSRLKWFLIAAVFFMTCFLLFIGLGIIVLAAGIGQLVPEQMNGNGPLLETVVSNGSGIRSDTVALINVAGMIDGDGSHVYGSGMLADISKQLRQAAASSDVKAVILQVDSGGGGLTASDVIYNEVLRLKQAGKKVVVLVGYAAASGAYYISAPADHIIAGPTSIIGSFGVIRPHFELGGFLESHGIKYAPIKSTDGKDSGSMFRAMTDEERETAKQMLDHYHSRFIEIIADNRNLDKDQVRKLADGRVYTSDEALGYKLIDEIGYYDAAIKKAKELGGIVRAPRVVVFRSPPSVIQQLMQVKSDSASDTINRAIDKILSRSAEKPQALWTEPKSH